MGVQAWFSNLLENGQEEPDWAIVLNVMHRSEPPEELSDIVSTQPVFTVGVISNMANMEYSRVRQASNRLQDWGLVNLTESEVPNKEEPMIGVEFTDDGFAVAHERQLSNNQNQINDSLAFFTFVLVILNGIDIISVDEIVVEIGVSVMLLAVLVYHYSR